MDVDNELSLTLPPESAQQKFQRDLDAFLAKPVRDQGLVGNKLGVDNADFFTFVVSKLGIEAQTPTHRSTIRSIGSKEPDVQIDYIPTRHPKVYLQISTDKDTGDLISRSLIKVSHLEERFKIQ